MELTIGSQPQKHSVWDDYVPIIVTGRTTTVYLTSGIETPAEYNELIHKLDEAYAGDEFVFILNNGGGYTSSAFMVTNAMKNSKATIHGKLSGTVASAATTITMECDTIEVAPHTQFMIHNYFFGIEGSGGQVKEYVNFVDKEFRKAAKEEYIGFLSDAEVDRVSSDDKELWFGADEVRERWVKHVAARSSVADEVIDED